MCAADAAFQIATVVVVEKCRAVAEQHKLRRRNRPVASVVRLRGIEELETPAAFRRGCLRGDRITQKPVQWPGPEPGLRGFPDLFDGVKEPRDFGAAFRGTKDQRR